MPPMTAMTTESMLAFVGKLVALMIDSEWPYIAPPIPARKPARAKPCSLTAAAGTVNDRAASSLSRTAISRRPMPPDRTLRASHRANSSVTSPT
jgi:hypothetical protein